jgi:hypothetical protein
LFIVAKVRFWGYLLLDHLWHAKRLSRHSDLMPMFLSLNTALGVCLSLAFTQPAKHRLMIAYGAWSSLAHAFTMTIMARAIENFEASISSGAFIHP